MALNQEGYPLTFEPHNQNLLTLNRDLRPQQNRVLKDTCKLKKFESSFTIDAARLWNAAPKEITCASSLNIAKNAVRLFCKNLPL